MLTNWMPTSPYRVWNACLVATLLMWSSGLQSSALFAEEPTNIATLAKDGKRLVFKHVVAVMGEYYGEKRILVLATGQKVSGKVLAAVAKKDAEENVDSEVGQSYVKLVFLEDGTLRCLFGKGSTYSFGGRGEELVGQAALENGRFQGKATYKRTDDFAVNMTMSFDVPLVDGAGGGEPAAEVAEVLQPPVKPSVTGKFLGSGKDAKLKFVSIVEQEDFNDKPAVTIVFTEKDHSKSKKPAFDAGFAKFGSALILSVHHDGGIFGCEVCHSAHEKSPFSAVGDASMLEFEISGGNVTGHVSTGGTVEAFDQKWSLDLKFAAPLPESLRKKVGKSPRKTAVKPDSGSEDSDTDDPAGETAAAEAESGPKLAARLLALPAGSVNIQYKTLVEHIVFENIRPVPDLAKVFSAKLKEQGWKSAPGDLLGNKNAILKRTMGSAKLTIMISPKGTGSVVKVFTEGLDWSDANSNGETPADVTGAVSTPQEIDADPRKAAQRAIRDALQHLPSELIDDIEDDMDAAFEEELDKAMEEEDKEEE